MKPPSFDYLRPDSLEEALAALHTHGDDAKVLAGGQSLVAMLNMRLLAPEILVDISAINDLQGVQDDSAHVQVGAGVTQAQLTRWERIESTLPLVARALQHVGHYQTRARGTVCGSLAHADPSSELPLCLATLGGEVVLQSAGRSRVLDAPRFQTGMLETACEPEEVLTAVRFPVRRPGEGQAFKEFSRRHGDFAVVAVAATVYGDETRLGVGGIHHRPHVTCWPRLDPAQIDEALHSMVAEMDIASDRNAPAAYRAQLVRVLGRRAIVEARACRC